MDHEKEKQDLLGRLFALATAKFEDGAGLAAYGQAPTASIEPRADLAERLRALADELTLICEATNVLCRLLT